MTAVLIAVALARPGPFETLALVCLVTLAIAPSLVMNSVAAYVPHKKLEWRALQGLALFVLVGLPTAYAAYHLLPSTLDAIPEAVPLMFVGAAMVVVVVRRFGRNRLGLPEEATFWFAACLAAVQLTALLLIAHVGEATYSLVNPGTGRERELAYLGTWGLSVFLWIPWSHWIWLRRGPRVSTPSALVGSAIPFATGIALLYANRSYLVGLHEDLHVWMIIVGTLSLDAGLSLSLGRSRWFRTRRCMPWGGALASLVILVSALVGFIQPSVFKPTRPALAAGPYASLLAHDAWQQCSGNAVPCAQDHDLLHVPKHHDYKRDDNDFNDFNILFVTVDALRADYIAPEPTHTHATRAPFLAKFASESLNFVNTSATGTRTAIGMGCVMACRYSANLTWDLWLVSGHGDQDYAIHAPGTMTASELEAQTIRVRGYTTFPRWSDSPTLAQRMRDAGYRTMAVPYGGPRASTWFSKGGFELGFDRFHGFKGAVRNPARTTIDIALAQIDDSNDESETRKWFQWIHLYDTHEWGKKRSTYDRQAHKIDRGIQHLIVGLKKRRLLDNTVVVISADHGEGFGEHRQRRHASSLYWEQTRVPLLIKIPGVVPQRIDRPTSTLDAVATMLALAEANLKDVDGTNLLPLADGKDLVRSPVFTELHRFKRGRLSTDLHAVLLDHWKLILNRKTDTAMLFDLEIDPNEKTNVAADHPRVLDDLGRLLTAFLYQGELAHALPRLPVHPSRDG